MPRQNNRDIQINSLLEKKASEVKFRKAPVKKDTKPYRVPGDNNNTTFFCSTPERGQGKVNDYIREHKQYWVK
jgi:hypothetical protein